MTNTAIRLDAGLRARLEAYAARVEADTGVHTTMSGAARALLVKGLESVEAEQPAAKPRRRR